MSHLFHRPALKFFFLLFVVAALSACDCAYPFSINALATVDGVLYTNADLELQQIPEDAVANVQAQLSESRGLPKVVCADTQTCYRITGKDEIESSRDGGQTWRADWRVPWGRKGYAERWTDVCRPEVDVTPRDLLLIDANGGYMVYAAMGQSGLLVRSPDGSWTNDSNRTGNLLPFYARNLNEALDATFEEIVFWLLLSVLAWVGLSAVGWWHSRAASGKPLSAGQVTWWILRPFLAIVALYILFTTFPRLLYGGYLPVGLLLIPALLFLIPIWTWWQVARSVSEPAEVWKSAWAVALAVMGFWLAWLPFVAWAFGLISFYWLAAIVSAAIMFFILRRSIRAISRYGRAAGGQPPSA